MLTHMFWAYGNFGRMETICANSFVKNGFDLQIWTYGDFNEIPGAHIRDAREIFPESFVFLNSVGSYAGFSDLFRYGVLNRLGGLYVDTDVVALKNAKDMPKKQFLVTQRQPDNGGLMINGNVIFNPSPTLGNIVDLAEVYAARFPKEKITWSEIGPALLTAIVQSYPLHDFDILPPEFANSVNYWDSPDIFIKKIEWSPPLDAFFLHLFNEMWRRSNINKNNKFNHDCIYEYLANKYL